VIAQAHALRLWKAAALSETIIGIKTVKAKALEPQRRAQWDERVAETGKWRLAFARLSNWPQTPVCEQYFGFTDAAGVKEELARFAAPPHVYQTLPVGQHAREFIAGPRRGRPLELRGEREWPSAKPNVGYAWHALHPALRANRSISTSAPRARPVTPMQVRAGKRPGAK
jgi:hypothetical protein